MNDPLALYNKYRPQRWEDIVGQAAAVKSMRDVVRDRSAQSYLLLGPSGCGKTTLARIAAKQLGCTPEALMEEAAAVKTGVDDVRNILNAVDYLPFNSPVRCIIMDEAARLSGNAWDSLLKAIEEPPKYLYWFFCTTNAAKVPETIKTRSHKVILKELTDDELGQLYDNVAEAEGISLPDEVVNIVIREAGGSARQMLVNLAACRNIRTKKEAAQILHSVVETEAVLNLCRLLGNGQASWAKLMTACERLDDEEPESIRIIVNNYMAKALRGSKTERDAVHFLNLLEAFATPYHPAEGRAPLYRSIGRVAFP